MAIPMIISMIICSWGKSIWLQVFCSAVNGFCSGFGPATCILRNEEDIVQIEYQRIEHENNGGDVHDAKAYNKTAAVPEMFIGIIFTCFSYLIVWIGGLLYNENKLSQTLTVWILALILAIIFGLFFFLYGCKEPDYFTTGRQEQTTSQLKSKRLLGNMGALFEFFFDDEDLMYQTLAVKLYEAIRLVDYVFMLVMLQTHPYWKGLHLPRMKLISWSIVGCILGFIAAEVILKKVIDINNAGKYMRWTAILSLVLYPILNSIIASVSYRKPGWAVFAYFISELIKFFLLELMREGLHETVNKNIQGSGKEKFRGLGLYAENVFKFISFLIFGSIISKFMKSMRIQKLNPYNYLFSFLILCLPLLGTYFLLYIGKLKEESSGAKDNNQQSNNTDPATNTQ
jgi:hypothetical protein